MNLHDYQKSCLSKLEEFFRKIGEEKKSASLAFNEVVADSNNPCKYVPAHKMHETLPYVCVRVPTGGGKTLLASHAVGIAAEHLHLDPPICLWLAPSNAIVKQTLKSLQDPNNLHHLAIAKRFNSFQCVKIEDINTITASDWHNSAIIIVATIQTFRVDNIDGRKVYAIDSALMGHNASQPNDKRTRINSLSKIIAARSPIIISDEAHNSITTLSYETLARLTPSCVIEFTATPQMTSDDANGRYSSNILCQASGRQLYSAGRIKMPLILDSHNDWEDCVQNAKEKRQELETAANHTARPIVLYQAASKERHPDVSEIKNKLESLGVPPNHIVVHTGKNRGLDNVDLLEKKCEIRHIITIRALAEGWDCPSAYILCAASGTSSERFAEQLVGRIVRNLTSLPPDAAPELKQCYVFSADSRFEEVVTNLKNALVLHAGFNKLEIADFIKANRSENAGLLFPKHQTASSGLPSDIAPVKVPMLSVREGKQLTFLVREHLLDIEWSIANESPDISKFVMPDGRGMRSVIGINDKDKVQTMSINLIQEQKQEQLPAIGDEYSVESLARWLNINVINEDIPTTQSAPYILKAVTTLAIDHDINTLGRYRHDVKKTIVDAINILRDKKCIEGYQAMLKMDISNHTLTVSPECSLTYKERYYAPSEYCDHPEIFSKHLFPIVGYLKLNSEEWECAKWLDQAEEVETWVRNLERSSHSFWLQTATDKFYPDFVCRLKDGRILVVEYKGKHLWSSDDSKEKRIIGKMWADLSKGKCLFIMPEGKNLTSIKELIQNKR